MPKFPVYSACDLISKENTESQVVIHKLKDLLTEDEYIPKNPHRHTFYQILFVEEGSGIHKIDFQEYEIKAPVVFFLSPGQVHDLVFNRAKTEGFIINFNGDFFNSFLTKSNDIDLLPFFGVSNNNICLPVSDDNLETFKEIFKKISNVFWDKNKMYEELMRVYILEFFYTLLSRTPLETENINITTQKNLIYRFERLVEENFAAEHYPKFYADKLAITANYLNFVCRNFLGIKAGEIIRNRIILEAKRLLANSELSISQISFQLGFDDNSYFTKFFKTYSGNSPSEFRNSLNK